MKTSEPLLNSAVGMRIVLIFIGAMALCAGSGCTLGRAVRDQLAYCEPVDSFLAGCRAGSAADTAWREYAAACGDSPRHSDFGRGYRAGFRDVALGGNGCTPAMPPRVYWSSRFQTPEGQERIGEWFSGYPLGAQAAEQQGMGNWYRLQTSLPEYAKGSAGPEFNPPEFPGTVPLDGSDSQLERLPPVIPTVPTEAPLAPIVDRFQTRSYGPPRVLQ